MFVEDENWKVEKKNRGSLSQLGIEFLFTTHSFQATQHFSIQTFSLSISISLFLNQMNHHFRINNYQEQTSKVQTLSMIIKSYRDQSFYEPTAPRFIFPCTILTRFDTLKRCREKPEKHEVSSLENGEDSSKLLSSDSLQHNKIDNSIKRTIWNYKSSVVPNRPSTEWLVRRCALCTQN